MLTWTTKKPTKDGVYWLRDEISDCCIVLVLEGAAMVMGSNCWSPIEEFNGEWAGPIEPPEG